MTNFYLAPVLTLANQLVEGLCNSGYVVASSETVAELSGVAVSELEKLNPFWEDLSRDPYLKDGGRYRYRRHASYEIQGKSLKLVPHRAD